MDYILRKMDYKRIGIIRSSNRYGRFGVREVRDSARRMGRPIVVEMAYRVGSDDFSLQLERLRAAQPDVVVHWGDAREAALVLNQMRASNMNQPFFASDRAVSEEFTRLAGRNAEGVIAGFPWNPERDDPKYLTFQAAFRKRYGEDPETYAAHGYDGMNMLIWAIQNAGLNRAKIRDLLAYRNKPWPGVTGDIPFSAVLDDIGEVFLARFEGGRWRYHSRQDLQVPKGKVPRRQPESVGLAPPKPQ
jgi:ABC-type branched-subunit amino acid transport system substrate-binding protein